jgi:hypothetical protein
MLFRPYALKPQELEGRALELWGEFPLWFEQEFLIAAEPKHTVKARRSPRDLHLTFFIFLNPE